MNDETSLPVLPGRLSARCWQQVDAGHYRAIVRAATETLALLVPAPLRRPTDPVTIRTRHGYRTYRPCSRGHRLVILSGLAPTGCTTCQRVPTEGAE